MAASIRPTAYCVSSSSYYVAVVRVQRGQLPYRSTSITLRKVWKIGGSPGSRRRNAIASM
jgi:hypothetical protein